MTDRPCPVSIADIFQAEFKPFTEIDWCGYAGVEGEGYIAYIEVDENGYEIVLDAGTTNDVMIFGYSDARPDFDCWAISIPAATKIL